LEKPDAVNVVDNLLGKTTKKILEFTRFKLKTIDSIGTEVASILPGKSIVDEGMNMRIAQFQLRDREDIKEHSGYVTAQMALNSLEEAVEGMEKQIEKANKNVDRNIEYMLGCSGYSHSGSVYERQVVVDSSLLGGDEWKTQTINAYRYYDTPDFELGVDLRPQYVKGMSADGINCLVAQGLRNLTKQMEEVFGGGDDDLVENLGLDDVASSETLDNEEEEELDGLFNKWVGEAPELIKKPDPNKSIKKNIKVAGQGEMGRMFTVFYDQEFKKQIGEAKASAPFFSKPLWGGKFLGMAAPSLKDIVNIGVSIAVATIPGGNVIGLALLNTIDDAVFTTANVATGNMTWDEGLFSIAQAGLGAVVSSQIGDIFDGSMIADPGSIGEVVSNTLAVGMEKFTTNMTVGALNSIQYRSGGQFGFNSSGYVKGMIGTEALDSYAGSMAGEFTKGSLGLLNLRDSLGLEWDEKIANRKNIYEFNSTIGNLVNAGIDFGLTGDTTINILNASDFIPGLNSRVGLFELGIDSKRGVSTRLGMGGIRYKRGKSNTGRSRRWRSFKISQYFFIGRV